MHAKFYLVNLALIFAMILGGSCFLSTASDAQSIKSAPYEIAPMPKPMHKMAGETACPYFTANTYTGATRVAFSYYSDSTKKTSKQDENAHIENVTVVISNNAVPTGSMVGMDDNRQWLWELDMSQETYKENQACLPKIAAPATAAK
jgi:hypothetical protein